MPAQLSRHTSSDATSQQNLPEVVLSCEHLTLGWDPKTPVLKDVSLELHAGELLCLVGRSGCGKTTLMQALSGLVAPQSGSVYTHGVNTTATPGHVGYMLQKDLLLPQLRVLDNVALPLTLAGVPKRKARAQAQALLAEFPALVPLAQRWPYELSGGQRQRIAFLRCQMAAKDVVLLDEPFSALDALTRQEMRSWFCERVRALGWSCLMITHDVNEAVALADRVLVLGPKPPRTGKSLTSAPAQILAELEPDRGSLTPEEFELTQEFLTIKAKVLAALLSCRVLLGAPIDMCKSMRPAPN